MVLLRAVFTVALLVTPQAANADGRIYASDYTPEIPDQRALIAFDGERQVMVIENHVALPDGRPATSLGWVVPVPDVPEISVAETAVVGRGYRSLRHRIDPLTLPVAPFVFGAALMGLVVAFRQPRSERPDVKTLGGAAWIGLIGSILAAFSLSAPMPGGADSGVNVVKALQVGPLDAKVVRASSGAELVDWLNSNGFAYAERDVAVVGDYLRQKWLFVVAKLAPRPGHAFEGASKSPPLVLSFPTREAVYPVALTAVGGKPLDLVLYVFAPGRVQSSVLMTVEYAGIGHDEMFPLSFSHPPGISNRDDVEADKAQVLWSDVQKGASYLTKLSGKLSPEDMLTDIRLVKASVTGDSYRRWSTGPIFNVWFGGAGVVALAALLLQLAGRGRWKCNAVVWFMISICMSPLALMLLLGSVGQQWWEWRKA